MTLLDVVQPVTTSQGGVRERFPSSLFLWWAIGLALTAGFGQGMLLFLHLAAGQPSGLWWLAAVQAHGHVQLFGWGGMFALGIGLYFLPRLRGCPAPSARAIRTAAWLLGGGLALWALSQPAVAALGSGGLGSTAVATLALSGFLELAGAGLAVGALVVAARKGPPLASRAGLVAVLPFAVTFFTSLLVALAMNAVVLVTDARSTGLVPGAADWTIVHLGLVGMLVTISAAVSARTFRIQISGPTTAAGPLNAPSWLVHRNPGQRVVARQECTARCPPNRLPVVRRPRPNAPSGRQPSSARWPR